MAHASIINNYADLPVGLYMDIIAVDRSPLGEFDKQVRIISILSGIAEADILALPVPEYKRIAAATEFLIHPCQEGRMAKSYRLGDLVLVPTQDLTKITAAQYIDFQTLSQEGEEKTVELCSVFLVPKGHKYADGYDIADVQDAIRRHLSVQDVVTLAAFFFTQVCGINRLFPNLLQAGDPAHEGPEGEGGDGGGTDGGGDDAPAAGGFADRWGWIANVDLVSDTCRCSWDDAFRMTAIEFFNVVSYARDKAEKQKEEIRRWQRTH